jgi:hypothetical protein
MMRNWAYCNGRRPEATLDVIDRCPKGRKVATGPVPVIRVRRITVCCSLMTGHTRVQGSRNLTDGDAWLSQCRGTRLPHELIPRNRNSFTSLSCNVRRARLTHPLAGLLFAQNVSMFNSYVARPKCVTLLPSLFAPALRNTLYFAHSLRWRQPCA